MRHRIVAAGVLALAVVLPRAGRADELEGTLGQPIVETLHAVHVSLDGDVVVQTVMRSFHNDGDEPDELEIQLDLPGEAAVSGVRVREGAGKWVDGALLEAGVAGDRYWALTQPGEGPSRLVALVAWDWQDHAVAHLFPVGAGKTVTLEVEVTVATRYLNARLYVEVPRPHTLPGGVKPVVTVARELGDVVMAEPDPGRDTNDDGDHDGYGSLWLSVADPAAPATGEIDVRYGLYPAGPEARILRVEMDVAARLGEAPARQRVVFVVDASASEGAAGIDAQLQLVRGYLGHVPGAEFDIVLFRRRATRLLGAFSPAAKLDDVLDERQAAFVPGNGSHLDAGLAEAVAALAGSELPARVVITSDQRLRASFDLGKAIETLAGLPAGAVVHVVHRDRGDGSSLAEQYHADSDLLELAHAGGGTALIVTGNDTDPAALAEVTAPLVRPLRVDALSVVVGWDDDYPMEWTGDLGEGAGPRRMMVTSDAPENVVASGWIWGRRWEKTVTPDARLSARLPALIFGHSAHTNLSDEDMARVARAGGVVSPVTSFLAETPGAQPGDQGFAVGGVGVGSVGGIAGSSTHCGGCGIGHGSGVNWGAHIAAWLDPAARACAREARARRLSMRLTVETTGPEVVDVLVPTGYPRDLRACIEEAAWRLTISPRFPSGAWEVSLQIDPSAPAPVAPAEDDDTGVVTIL